MSFEGIIEIKSEEDIAVVNAKLTEGWELLAITSGVEGPVYTIGRRAMKKEPSAKSVLDAHATQP